jgi:hypothetical protein
MSEPKDHKAESECCIQVTVKHGPGCCAPEATEGEPQPGQKTFKIICPPAGEAGARTIKVVCCPEKAPDAPPASAE